MLLAEEIAKTWLSDPWTAGILIATLLGSLVTAALSVGWNARGLRELEKRQKEDRDNAKEERAEMKSDLGKIFGKLDTLAQVVPHRCEQTETIGNLKAMVAKLEVEVVQHEHRMDRIQATIERNLLTVRDKEQAILCEGDRKK